MNLYFNIHICFQAKQMKLEKLNFKVNIINSSLQFLFICYFSIILILSHLDSPYYDDDIYVLNQYNNYILDLDLKYSYPDFFKINHFIDMDKNLKEHKK